MVNYICWKSRIYLSLQKY